MCLGRKYVIDDDSPKGERSGLESKGPFCRFFFNPTFRRGQSFSPLLHSSLLIFGEEQNNCVGPLCHFSCT